MIIINIVYRYTYGIIEYRGRKGRGGGVFVTYVGVRSILCKSFVVSHGLKTE